MLNSDIAIDFGTSNLRIFMEGKGIVINEPDFMAVDNIKDEVLGVGREAYQMIGRTTKQITVEHPFNYGVISNYAMAEHMIVKYIKRISAGKIFLPSALVSVPMGINEVERHAIIDIITEAGIRKINFVFEPFAAALGVDLDIFGSKGIMVVDIGSSKSTASVISAGRAYVSNVIKLGGNDFDQAIIRYIRKKYAMEIGHLSAEQLKLEIGSAAPREKLLFCHVKGKDINTDMPRDITVTSDDMVEALAEFVGRITDFIQNTISDVSVSVLNDISEDGIKIVGGSGNLFGIDTAIKRKTGIKTIICENPESAVVLGAGSALKLQSKSNARPIFL